MKFVKERKGDLTALEADISKIKKIGIAYPKDYSDRFKIAPICEELNNIPAPCRLLY